MVEKKGPFQKELAEAIIDGLKTAPESQLSKKLKLDSIDFFATEKSLGETYDYINSISEQPITEASPFIRTMCNLSDFYERPE